MKVLLNSASNYRGYDGIAEFNSLYDIIKIITEKGDIIITAITV